MNSKLNLTYSLSNQDSSFEIIPLQLNQIMKKITTFNN